MPLLTRVDPAKALARTYGGDRDPWERVQKYQHVMEYSGEHPTRLVGRRVGARTPSRPLRP